MVAWGTLGLKFQDFGLRNIIYDLVYIIIIITFIRTQANGTG